MSRRVVGDVAVRVGADVGPLKIGLQDGARQVDRFGKRGAARARALALAVRGVGVAALAMGGAVAAGAGRAISALDGIGKKAAQIGITAEALQELRFAAKSAGVDNAKLESSLERFSKRLGEAQQGFGAAKKQLEELGLSANYLANLPLDRALEIVGQRISELELPTQRAAAAAGLFGREGVAMVNMLRDGAEGLRQVRKDARDMGAVVSNEIVDKAEAAEDRLGRLKDVITAQLSTALVEAAPLLEGMAFGIAEIAKAANTAIGSIGDFVTTVIGAFQKSEKELAQFEAAMAQRQENARKRATKGRGGIDTTDRPGVDDLAGGISDLFDGLSNPAGPQGPRADANAARAERERRAAELEAQKEAWEQEAQSYLEHLGRIQTIEEEDRIRRAELEAAAKAKEIEEKQKHEDTKTEVASGGMSERQKRLSEHLAEMARMEQKWERERERGIGQFWSDITSLMQSSNETAFKIGKAFSVAKAVIDGREAAIGAYKVGARIGGPPLGAAFAAASIAATASMIQQIVQTQPGGGAGVASSGPGGGGGVQNAGSITQAAQEQPAQQRSLTLLGDRFNREQAIEIAEFMNDGTDDGLIIRGGR